MTVIGRILVFGLVVAMLAAAYVGGSWWGGRADQREYEAAQGAIQGVYVAYRNATIADDGAASASLLGSDSRAYFREVHRETLFADERRLDQLDPVRRLLVLSLRAIAIKRNLDLSQFTEGELTALAFESKIIGQDLEAGYELDVAVVHGTYAAGRLRIGDRLLERRNWFQRDADGWRYDILPVFAGWGKSLEERARELGVETSHVVDMTVEAFQRLGLDPGIFKPVMPLVVINSTDAGVTQ